MIAIGAWFGGLWRVVRSPWLVALAYAALLAMTVPLGMILQRQLPSPSQPSVVEPGAGPVPDLDWLDEVRAGRDGLIGTLSPVVVGVAAPLDNLDRLLARRLPPPFTIALSGGSLIVWAWLWGGVISRLSGARRGFLSACGESFAPVMKVSLVGLIVAIGLFATLHPLLFDVALPALTSGISERAVFAWRVVLTIPFIAALTLTTLVSDYARIEIVLNAGTPLRAAIANALQLVRANAIAVLTLVVVAAVLLAGLLLTYGAFEFIPGGSVPRLGRVIVLGQAFILTRIALRFVNAAAQVVLYQRVRLREATR